jgi:hypothetical protein
VANRDLKSHSLRSHNLLRGSPGTQSVNSVIASTQESISVFLSVGTWSRQGTNEGQAGGERALDSGPNDNIIAPFNPLKSFFN